MNFSSPFVIIFLAGTILNFLLDNFLEFIDFKNRKNNGQKIPQELEGSVKPETLAKTCLYEDAQYKLWIPENILRTLLSLVLICPDFNAFYDFCFNSRNYFELAVWTLPWICPWKKVWIFNDDIQTLDSGCHKRIHCKHTPYRCPFCDYVSNIQ